MDRDLQRTGNSIVLVSAGNGVFAVDKQLANITKQRMLDNGIGMDMVSLALPPLHTAPIFMVRPRSTLGLKKVKSQKRVYDYEVPHWINLSFVEPDRALDPRAWITAAAPRRARRGWRVASLGLDTPRRRRSTDGENRTLEKQLHRKKMLYHKAGPHQNTDLVTSLQSASLGSSDRQTSDGGADKRSSCSQRTTGHVHDDDDGRCVAAQEVRPHSQQQYHRYRRHTKTFVPEALAYLVGAPQETRRRREEEEEEDNLNDAAIYYGAPRCALPTASGGLHGDLASDYAASYSSSVGIGEQAWPPSIHIGSLTSRNAREETMTQWVDIGADGGRATSAGPSPETGASPIAHGWWRSARPGHQRRPASPTPLREEQYDDDDDDRSGDRDDDIPYRPFQETAQSYTYAASPDSRQQSLANLPPNSPRRSASNDVDAPVGFRRRTLESRSPSRPPRSLEEHFDAHDEAAFDPEVAPPDPVSSEHEPLTRRNTFSSAVAPASFSRGTAPGHHHAAASPPSQAPPRTGDQFAVVAQPTPPPTSTGRRHDARRSHRSGNAANVASSSNQDLQHQPSSRAAQSMTGGLRHSLDHGDDILSSLKKGPESEDPAGDRSRHRVNPFKREDEEEVLKQQSHNRRRWSHVFPEGEEEFRSTQGAVPGLYWKSLTTPAILPLEMDYLPADFGTGSYSSQTYRKAIKEEKGERTIVEMIAQRIGGDYQIVVEKKPKENGETEEGKKSTGGGAAGSSAAFAARGRSNFFGDKSKTWPWSASSRRPSGAVETYTLSMGHRIQKLTYDPVTMEVDVATFRSTSDNTRAVNQFEYDYSLWLSTANEGDGGPDNDDNTFSNNNNKTKNKQANNSGPEDGFPHQQRNNNKAPSLGGAFVRKKQTFLKYPSPETNWNKLDEVICGWGNPPDTMHHVKFRRILFAVVPPPGLQSQSEDYLRRVNMFKMILKSKRADASNLQSANMQSAAAPQAIKMKKPPSPTADGQISAAFEAASSLQANTPKKGQQQPQVYPRPKKREHLQITLENSRWRDEWLAVESDAEVDTSRCYRFAVHWLLCSGWVVEEFLSSLCRKAKHYGLRLCQVPEYSLQTDVHPFVTPKPAVDASDSHLLVQLLELALVDKFDFVRDSATVLEQQKQPKPPTAPPTKDATQKQPIKEAPATPSKESLLQLQTTGATPPPPKDADAENQKQATAPTTPTRVMTATQKQTIYIATTPKDATQTPPKSTTTTPEDATRKQQKTTAMDADAKQARTAMDAARKQTRTLMTTPTKAKNANEPQSQGAAASKETSKAKDATPAPPTTSQYFHRSGSAFIRLEPSGHFTWLRNRLKVPYGSFKVVQSASAILPPFRHRARKLRLLLATVAKKLPSEAIFERARYETRASEEQQEAKKDASEPAVEKTPAQKAKEEAKEEKQQKTRERFKATLARLEALETQKHARFLRVIDRVADFLEPAFNFSTDPAVPDEDLPGRAPQHTPTMRRATSKAPSLSQRESRETSPAAQARSVSTSRDDDEPPVYDAFSAPSALPV